MKLKKLENILTETLNKLVEEEENLETNNKESNPTYIYERNPDSGEIFRRVKGDYENKELLNPKVNKK